MTRKTDSQQFQHDACWWRGFDPADACKRCGGTGTIAYGSTSTWRGGPSGQMITSGPCDKCWGSGEQDRPWPSHRTFESMAERLKKAG